MCQPGALRRGDVLPDPAPGTRTYPGARGRRGALQHRKDNWPGRTTHTMTSNSDDVLQQLSDAGVSIWLDDISRERLTTGNLATLIRDRHVVGVTSNPTIFAHALSSGSAYDDQIADLEVREVGLEEATRAITTYDIRWACDVLRPVYDATSGTDGRVSLEVDPRIAGD